MSIHCSSLLPGIGFCRSAPNDTTRAALRISDLVIAWGTHADGSRPSARRPARTTGVGRRRLPQFIQCRLESRRKLLGRSCTPVVEEIDGRLAARQVVVNGHNVQAIAAER